MAQLKVSKGAQILWAESNDLSRSEEKRASSMRGLRSILVGDARRQDTTLITLLEFLKSG